MRLINADELMELYDGCDGLSVPIAVVQQNIKDATTIDAEPVRHGRWERTSDGAARCTECKRKMNPSQYGYAFCSLCGAKMDGGNNIMRGELNEKV